MLKYPVVETEFAKELKQAGTLAQWNIQSQTEGKKKHYDEWSNIKELNNGDLVALRFHLDQ